MKRLSRKNRADAALICAIQASNPEWQGFPMLLSSILGVGPMAGQIAVWAWLATPIECKNAYAEAESMLRTGWNPKKFQ